MSKSTHNRIKPPRKKKCKQCKGWFIPERDMQTTCSYVCAIAQAPDSIKKQARKELKAFKDQDVSELKKRAQKVVNAYVRLRDRDLCCISCGTMSGKWDAGHYMSQGGNSLLRYNTINIRKQCFRCNRMMSANLKEYRKYLIQIIGEERVEQLENTKGIKKHDAEYLKRLIDIFKRKIKAMKKRSIR